MCPPPLSFSLLLTRSAELSPNILLSKYRITQFDSVLAMAFLRCHVLNALLDSSSQEKLSVCPSMSFLSEPPPPPAYHISIKIAFAHLFHPGVRIDQQPLNLRSGVMFHCRFGGAFDRETFHVRKDSSCKDQAQ